MTSIRVVRVGGSLLTWDALNHALGAFLAEPCRAKTIFTTGGGPWVELLRQRAQRLSLLDLDAHWLCIGALSITAELLSVVSKYPLITDWKTIGSSHEPCSVLDVAPLLRNDEPQWAGTKLAESWDVTSDSIAARVAEMLHAEELVLLKSSDPPVFRNLEELAKVGFVDGFFPQAACSLPTVRFVNLRRYGA